MNCTKGYLEQGNNKIKVEEADTRMKTENKQN